jgi:glycosyltransferase involved in cell wall biosynthesis
LVSVIIPTRNSARTLRRCLESLMIQTFQNFDILIVDDRSEDHTIDIAREFKATIFTIEGERTTAKNFALARANGTFVFFLDSDMLLEPQVIEDCVNAIQPSDVGGVIIPEKTIGSGFWANVRDFERSFYFGTKIESARFFRAKEALQVGGFDEDVVSYEESTLPQKIEKIGLKTDARISTFILHEEGNFSLIKWLKKKRYYSRTDKTYTKKYTSYSRHQFSVTNRAKVYVRNGNWQRLLKNPVLATGLVTLKSLEFLSSKLKK